MKNGGVIDPVCRRPLRRLLWLSTDVAISRRERKLPTVAACCSERVMSIIEHTSH